MGHLVAVVLTLWSPIVVVIACNRCCSCLVLMIVLGYILVSLSLEKPFHMVRFSPAVYCLSVTSFS